MHCDSELLQAKPSILTLGEEPQVGDPLSTLPACFMLGEIPLGESRNGLCLPNSESWTTGLLVRAGGDPQKKPTWLPESESPSEAS